MGVLSKPWDAGTGRRALVGESGRLAGDCEGRAPDEEEDVAIGADGMAQAWETCG